MGYRLSRLDEPVFMAGPKPMLIEFGIHHRLESCVKLLPHIQNECACAAYTKPYQRLGDNCWNYVLCRQ